LAKKNNVSEYQVHQQLVHEAMSLRMILAERAGQIVRPAKREEEV